MKVFKLLLKIFWTALKVVFFVVPLCLIFYVLGAKVQGNVPYLFGYGMSIVTTGSMEDILPVGSVIISKQYDGSALETGEIITYEGRSGSYQGKLVTHEVIGFEQNGERIDTDPMKDDAVIITKGTMNNVEDPAITRDMVTSTFVCKLVNLGFVFTLLQKPGGTLLILIVPILALVVFEAWDLFRMFKKEPKKNDEKTDKEKRA